MNLSKSMLAAVAAAFSLPVFVLPVPALAQSMPGMEHRHHDDAPMTIEKLGSVHFPTSCLPASQVSMERGVALLHSFGYAEAETQFTDLTKSDPACAMAHWGAAMAEYHEIWEHPQPDALKSGAAEMERARTLAEAPKGATAREKAYIAALSAFYNGASTSYAAGADAYTAGMAKLHADFPGDVEASAFYALSLLADVAPGDTSLAKERKALAILGPLFEQHPDHPGLAHYIIHTCDTPALAPDGLAAAREYAKIAPSSAHALHMPGHIFARLGMWPEDVSSNLNSVAASEKAEQAGQPGVAHQLHADEFLIYAWLQMGDDTRARDLTGRIRSIGQHVDALPGADDMKGMGAYFDNELSTLYPLEMHEWSALAALQPSPGTTPDMLLWLMWGKGVAAGHLHDPKLAAEALAGFDAAVEATKKTPYADMVTAQSMIDRNDILGWQAYTEGRPEDAIAALRRAADQQDKLGQGEVDIPAREMLADLLMMLNRPQEALAQYKIALKLSPNRLNGLLGAGEAAEKSGQKAEAVAFYAQAAKNTQNAANSKRPELLHAVLFAGTHTTHAPVHTR
ncbi:MAG TPA: tetratricopeptide repeat protein [Acidobacteriaceae bacterium]|jgi:tetratricopeptide (TPR) repeat protein